MNVQALNKSPFINLVFKSPENSMNLFELCSTERKVVSIFELLSNKRKSSVPKLKSFGSGA
jgi:hypothetical protein